MGVLRPSCLRLGGGACGAPAHRGVACDEAPPRLSVVPRPAPPARTLRRWLLALRLRRHCHACRLCEPRTRPCRTPRSPPSSTLTASPPTEAAHGAGTTSVVRTALDPAAKKRKRRVHGRAPGQAGGQSWPIAERKAEHRAKPEVKKYRAKAHAVSATPVSRWSREPRRWWPDLWIAQCGVCGLCDRFMAKA